MRANRMPAHAMHTFGTQSCKRPAASARNWTEIADDVALQAPHAPELAARRLDSKPMKAAEIRERFLSFFEKNEPSARAVCVARSEQLRPVRSAHHGGHAAVQAVLPRRGGAAVAPADLAARSRSERWTSRSSAPRSGTSPSSRCSATSPWATTSRRRRSRIALDLSTSKEYGFGLEFDDIWITVFGGDEELGLGPDGEAIEHWRAVGVPDERIVLLGRG